MQFVQFLGLSSATWFGADGPACPCPVAGDIPIGTGFGKSNLSVSALTTGVVEP